MIAAAWAIVFVVGAFAGSVVGWAVCDWCHRVDDDIRHEVDRLARRDAIREGRR